ncbi:MAG TPA: DMT family transporter [Verrucomicrobiae bacterium]|nr:DMT family transporter [Verrucomicrobiae bacterium]
MRRTNPNFAIAASLAFAIFLWGGNNTATKWLVQSWPPIVVGQTRFLCAGLILVGLLRWTNLFGRPVPISSATSRRLWLRGGLSLAAYVTCFNWAMRFTSASHVALYLGASPVWALLLEERPGKSLRSLRRYGAAMLALAGVLTLFWPALHNAKTNLFGETLGLISSVLWTIYGRESRALSTSIPGVEVAAHTMWRAGAWLLPLAVFELFTTQTLTLTAAMVGIQLYCIICGGVIAFGIWNNALRFWPPSRVLLFNNLIPISTITWTHFCLGEPVTPTFCTAMLLIIAGVILGQSDLLLRTKQISPPE